MNKIFEKDFINQFQPKITPKNVLGMEEPRAPVTNDSQAGAALKAKPEKSEEKDSSGFASSQPNHIYFCCRHGIEHPSPLFLLHPSPYARRDWQWDGAAGGVVV